MNAKDYAYPQEINIQYRTDGMVYKNGAISLGITKREHYAAMAMQGILSDSSWKKSAENVAFATNYAVQMADALITALGGNT